MIRRSLLTLCIGSTIALSPAIGGLVSKDKPQPESIATRPRPADDVDTAKSASGASESASSESLAKPSRENMGQEKAVLSRLVTQLQRSPRSFIYLRSIGFAQTDKEFEELITRNDAIFRRTRIVRRDEQGNRQIPGWPGVTLTPEYKSRKQ
jgi:hypothetical protein